MLNKKFPHLNLIGTQIVKPTMQLKPASRIYLFTSDCLINLRKRTWCKSLTKLALCGVRNATSPVMVALAFVLSRGYSKSLSTHIFSSRGGCVVASDRTIYITGATAVDDTFKAPRLSAWLLQPNYVQLYELLSCLLGIGRILSNGQTKLIKAISCLYVLDS